MTDEKDGWIGELSPEKAKLLDEWSRGYVRGRAEGWREARAACLKVCEDLTKWYVQNLREVETVGVISVGESFFDILEDVPEDPPEEKP